MPNTPVAPPPVRSSHIVGGVVPEQELTELLQKALSPSFVLVRRLGAGGMGIVYLARDPALKRHVAVKVMSPDRGSDAEARARFQREAESVAAISHPNVVAVYSVGTLENGLPYLVMQYVDGSSMADRLAAEGPLDLETAKQVIGQVAAGLDAAHRKGIIHRDIKAANILWDEQAGRALVTDFGIASVLDHEYDGETLRLTQTGTSIGTPQYMSPEQLLSEKITAKTDIYSLGLLAYELVTGEGPYQPPTSPAALMASHLRDKPRPLSQMRPDADPVLESLLASCLEKEADARPSAEEVARRLQHGSSTLLEWPPPGLEDMQGAAVRVIDQVLWGSLAIAVPLAIVTTAPADSPLRQRWPLTLFNPIVAATGGLATLLAMKDALRLLRASLRASRAGYGWGIIAEVLVDANKDTGALIVGEREYASLSIQQRNDLRRRRVLRWALRAAAAAWALSSPVVALPIAVSVGNPTSFAALALGVPVALLVASGVVANRERSLLAGIRARLKRHRAPLERLSHLAATWRDSLDRMTQDFVRGQGTIGGRLRRVVVGVALGVTASVGALTAGGLIALSTRADAIWSQFGTINFYVREQMQEVTRLAALRPPVDAALTPRRAGELYHALTWMGPGPGGERLGPPQMRNIRLLRAPASPVGAIGNLPLISAAFPGGQWLNGGALRAASSGLTPDQRRFLEDVAKTPGAAEFRELSRARRIDWLGAALAGPVPASISPYELPQPWSGRLKTFGNINVARAALALAAGRTAEAEALLRENIGVGVALWESPVMVDNMIGVSLVRSARTELVALYDLTGRHAQARSLAASEDPSVEIPSVDLLAMAPSAREAWQVELIKDPNVPRGQRWEMARRLSISPCLDMRQVVFGPSVQHADGIAEARKTLVQTPGEDQLMTLVESTLERPTSGEQSLLSRVFGRIMQTLTRSKRAATCNALIGS